MSEPACPWEADLRLVACAKHGGPLTACPGWHGVLPAGVPVRIAPQPLVKQGGGPESEWEAVGHVGEAPG